MQLLQTAARVPDHGKLEPWRFIVLERAALDRLSPLLHEAVIEQGQDELAAEKAASAMESPLIIAVVFSPVDSPKVPEWEQFLSSGAVCLGLVNAALAAGWGASWLTGYTSHNADFGQRHLGITGAERIVGMIHLGTPGTPPTDRPRPDIASKMTFLS